MLRASGYASGWRGALLVAVTYIHFLIFAQFAFLSRLSALGISAWHLKAVMAAMAAGGILFSLLSPHVKKWPSPAVRLRAGFALSATAAFLAVLPLGFAAATGVAFLIGAGLAILTVTLVTHLREWTGSHDPLLAVGIGTGAGYLVCNFPFLFAAAPETQSIVAGGLCIAALFLPLRAGIVYAELPEEREDRQTPLVLLVAAFTALVWLDSAAFFIIQNNAVFKGSMWQGSAHLWVNGLLHFAAAIASGWLLKRRGTSAVLLASILVLGGACLLLLSPGQILLASALYPVGVSLYSVALVAFPSLLFRGSMEERGRLAGWLYAIAGWLGSALGIGMGQNLGYIPPLFVTAAGIIVLAPQIVALLRKRPREAVLVTVVALVSIFVSLLDHPVGASRITTAIERGRQVYISEGCIHCHSQYVRPGSPDVVMWGPVKPIDQLRLDQPPLIGNRRQGPDLTQVGARRSALWLKAHLIAPAEVSGASVMPSYAFLFRDQRGDDLVMYLAGLQSGDLADFRRGQEAWSLSSTLWSQASTSEGAQLYQRYCVTCHDDQGKTRIQWQHDFRWQPTALIHGPYRSLQADVSRDQRLLEIARIAKFGIAGTDMPGHEYLPDQQIASIAVWLSQHLEKSDAIPTKIPTIQEKNE
jgi:cytochrome c oxidase cbb3-type subunit 2